MTYPFGKVRVQRFCFSIEIQRVTCFCLFVGMSMATITAKPPRVFMRPACPTCGSRMLLVRIFPDKPGHDQYTYECPRCADEITEIVRAPSAPFTEMIK